MNSKSLGATTTLVVILFVGAILAIGATSISAQGCLYGTPGCYTQPAPAPEPVPEPERNPLYKGPESPRQSTVEPQPASVPTPEITLTPAQIKAHQRCKTDACRQRIIRNANRVAEREKAKAERAAHDAEIAKKQAETAKLALDVAKVALEACKQGGCKKVALKAAEDALRKAESVNSQAQAAVDKADKSLSDLARRAKENYEYNTRPWNGSPDDFWPAAGRELLGLPGDIVGLAVDRVEEIATGDPYGSSANPDD